jgi:hypothetical protein
MQQNTVTLIVAVVGIAGTFGSGYFSQRMARHSQREQWLRDCRRQEYRELVSALTTAVVGVVVYKEARDAQSARAEQLLKNVIDTHQSVYNVIADRIYIANEIKALNVLDRYSAILSDLRESRNESGPADRMSALIDEIVEVARGC